MTGVKLLHTPQPGALLAGFLARRKRLLHVAAVHVARHRLAHAIQRACAEM
jgi:hypothetical protein